MEGIVAEYCQCISTILTNWRKRGRFGRSLGRSEMEKCGLANKKQICQGETEYNPKTPSPTIWNGWIEPEAKISNAPIWSFYWIIFIEKDQTMRNMLFTLRKSAWLGFMTICVGFSRVFCRSGFPKFEKMLYDNGQLMELFASLSGHRR